jgi:hypothetical protein
MDSVIFSLFAYISGNLADLKVSFLDKLQHPVGESPTVMAKKVSFPRQM